jgi:hypothetical protein
VNIILEMQRAAICLVRHLEDFDFPHLEILRTREDDVAVQSGVVGVRDAKASATGGICAAVIVNKHVTNSWTLQANIVNPHATKQWTMRVITTDCEILILGPHCELPRRDVVWIFQREKKTLQAAVAFPLPTPRLPLQRREAAKDIPVRVQDERQRVRAPVAPPVKVSRAETVAASAPQKHKPLPAELVEERRQAREDQRVELAGAKLRWLNGSRRMSGQSDVADEPCQKVDEKHCQHRHNHHYHRRHEHICHVLYTSLKKSKFVINLLTAKYPFNKTNALLVGINSQPNCDLIFSFAFLSSCPRIPERSHLATTRQEINLLKTLNCRVCQWDSIVQWSRVSALFILINLAKLAVTLCTASANSKSNTSLGNTYTNDTGLDGKTVFTGSEHFHVSEIEVFEIAD